MIFWLKIRVLHIKDESSLLELAQKPSLSQMRKRSFSFLRFLIHYHFGKKERRMWREERRGRRVCWTHLNRPLSTTVVSKFWLVIFRAQLPPPPQKKKPRVPAKNNGFIQNKKTTETLLKYFSYLWNDAFGGVFFLFIGLPMANWPRPQEPPLLLIWVWNRTTYQTFFLVLFSTFMGIRDLRKKLKIWQKCRIPPVICIL